MAKKQDTRTEEQKRSDFLDKLELVFKNVTAMEIRLKKRGRDPLQNKEYVRLANVLRRNVAFARDKGWMRLPTATNN